MNPKFEDNNDKTLYFEILASHELVVCKGHESAFYTGAYYETTYYIMTCNFF